MPISLFPARAAIGRGTLPDGSSVDILMTIEFARALSDVLQRIGGTNGTPTATIESEVNALAASSVFGFPSPASVTSNIDPIDAGESAQISAMRSEIADLRTMISMIGSTIDLRSQLEEIRTILGMQDTRPGIIKGTATGSRGANVALASLLAALAQSGLVVDNTTI